MVQFHGSNAFASLAKHDLRNEVRQNLIQRRTYLGLDYVIDQHEINHMVDCLKNFRAKKMRRLLRKKPHTPN